MSFNWADEVEEELAGAFSHEQPSTQFAKDTQSEEEATSNLTPQVENEDVEKESASCAAQLRKTPSPEVPPSASARNSGIMQSRWATAPDEPVVEPDIDLRKGALSSLDQGGSVTPSRSRRGRGIHSGKKERTQGGRSGSNSLAGSPRKTNLEGNKHSKVRSTDARNEKAQSPARIVHNSPKINSASPCKSAKVFNDTANDQPATGIAPVIGRSTDGPAQTPGSSPSKNEISLSMWA
ncbi:hypothetical protein N0V82_002937 [Gnomoniopsis sp. IMI 355080]|nr:hypothetical protein N0V82_002937 [Gnomoniopsis sp. IMI 355080]